MRKALLYLEWRYGKEITVSTSSHSPYSRSGYLCLPMDVECVENLVNDDYHELWSWDDRCNCAWGGKRNKQSHSQKNLEIV